ncbi:helicase-related protein [Verrucomicrobium spinosum]|uniref:helicase-related protein n=1 Tax=Verrucomicrobium spinosum TaxID=2736 RepID=UPI0009465EC8|nr:helicase-related protein [Verrucomicrobium spinosum]
MIDEFHERHLDGDLCLAWARAIQAVHRPDLRIIVMSATITPEPLREFMNRARSSTLRAAPSVSISYQAPQRDKRGFEEAIWDQAARAAEDLVTTRGVQDDILIFMPGGHEIRKTISALQGRSFARGYRILPLHGELPPQQQDEVLQPGQGRRIIVSTNVAETSLTIEACAPSSTVAWPASPLTTPAVASTPSRCRKSAAPVRSNVPVAQVVWAPAWASASGRSGSICIGRRTNCRKSAGWT